MELLTVGQVAERSGLETSAVRYYEAQGLIASTRSEGGQRRYPRETLRRIAVVRAAQRVGLTLAEIRASLASLPDNRTPTPKDWARLSTEWRARLDANIALLEGLRDDLDSCIGCGCLSFDACALYNPADGARRLGPGPRFLLGNTAAEVEKPPR